MFATFYTNHHYFLNHPVSSELYAQLIDLFLFLILNSINDFYLNTNGR